MENNESIVRRLFEEAFNQGRLATIDELMSPDFVEHQGEGTGGGAGRAVPKAIVTTLRNAFPDLHLSIEDAAERDDTVWVRLKATGTHHGPFMGRMPTGRRISITVIDILRLADGRIVEHWGVPDALAALHQIDRAALESR